MNNPQLKLSFLFTEKLHWWCNE